MERQVRAVVEAYRDRRVRGRDRVDRRPLIDLFVAVPFAAGDPPGGAPGRDGEFGDLVGDLRGLEPGLPGQFVAEADAIIEQAESGEQFVVMIADEAALAPRLSEGS